MLDLWEMQSTPSLPLPLSPISYKIKSNVLFLIKETKPNLYRETLYGVMAKELDCDLKVSEKDDSSIK